MTDEFTKETIKKFGSRGSTVFEQEEKTTDLDDLAERVEETAVPFCTCGAALTTTEEAYRCCHCDVICCQRCQIELSRYHYCPVCIRQRFSLDKRTFLSLIFLQHDLMAPDDLIEVATMGDDVIEVDIDPTADALVEHDYLTDDGELSPEGQEALHVGHQLYGDDDDVQSVVKRIRHREVVNRG